MSVYALEQKQQKKQILPRSKKNKKELSQEDIFVLATLERLNMDLKTIHRSLDAVTDPDLIDSFIYEMNAINMRYKFYLQICRDKGLVSAMF